MLIASLLFFLPPVYRISGDLESTVVVRLYPSFSFEERGKSPDLRSLGRRAVNNRKPAVKEDNSEQAPSDDNKIQELPEKPVQETAVDSPEQRLDIAVKSEASESEEKPLQNEMDSAENKADKEESKPVLKEEAYQISQAIEKQDVPVKDKETSTPSQPRKPDSSNNIAMPEDTAAAEIVKSVPPAAEGVYVQTDKEPESHIVQQAMVLKTKEDTPDKTPKDAVKADKSSLAQGQDSTGAKIKKETTNKPPLKKSLSADAAKAVKEGSGTEKPVITIRDILNSPVFFMPKTIASGSVNDDTASGGDALSSALKTEPSNGAAGEDKTAKTSEHLLPIMPEIIKSQEPNAGNQNIGGVVVIEPMVKGDLKLEITVVEGSLKGLKVTAVYKEYPKNRRNQPMSKSEVRRARRIIEPAVVNHGDNISIYIISETGEGVYDFMIESEGKAAKAGFVLKIYEQKDNMAVKSLGELTVMNKTLIARILMPEGILWDDDSYFSGDMEDSESFTKFNKDSGLIWREYKE